MIQALRQTVVLETTVRLMCMFPSLPPVRLGEKSNWMDQAQWESVAADAVADVGQAAGIAGRNAPIQVDPNADSVLRILEQQT